MCDQQSLRSAWHMRSLVRAFASRLDILWLFSYWLNTIWSYLHVAWKEAAQARLSLHMSKYHIVGNHMSRLVCVPQLVRFVEMHKIVVNRHRKPVSDRWGWRRQTGLWGSVKNNWDLNQLKMDTYLDDISLQLYVIYLTRKSVHGTQMPPPIVFISPAIKHWVYNKWTGYHLHTTNWIYSNIILIKRVII